MGRNSKTSADMWIDAARRCLIDEGIAGVKVDRLASKLGVSRGGFYHNFTDRDDLLDQLVEHWAINCRFLPHDPPGKSPPEAAAWFDRAVERLILNDGFDHRFDMAIRDWGRSDSRARVAIDRADGERISALGAFFAALGYSSAEAAIRARVFYFHQIGYYAIGVNATVEDRKKTAALYIDILCGAGVLAAARGKQKQVHGD